MKDIVQKISNDFNTLNETRSGKFNNLDKFAIISILVIAALLYIPFLGNFLMIDPWENHYSHVAWETLERGSFAKLWYQNSNNFWSKPPLLFWMLMPFFKLHISEFMGRLPVALFSIATLAGFYILLSRLVSRRSALISTFVLMLSPQYFMLSRQIMVDLPFISLNTIAMLCMAIYFVGDIDENEKWLKIPKRDLYLYLFYFFEGWAFLAKGLLSVVIPGTALLVFMIFTRNFGYFFAWRRLKKHLIGFVVYLVVIMPWFGYMWITEGQEFFNIFIIFHHFKRTVGIIHKPNDLYTLYVRILGYAMFPWSAFLPAALYHFITNKKENTFLGTKKLFLLSMFIGPFFFLSFSSTKFYHYIAVVVPFLAIFIGSYINKIWNERWTLSSKIESVIAILLVAAIGKDLGNKYNLWLHIVTFYNTRSVSNVASWEFVIISVFTLFCIIIFLMIFNSFMRKKGFYMLFTLTAGFMLYYFIVCLPVLSVSYSLKPHVEAYLKDSPERAPIADYYKWLRKSAAFWLKNDITFLQPDKEKSVLRFFDKPGDQYVILHNKNKKRFDSLMKRINKKGVVVYEGAKNKLLKVTGPGKARNFSNAKRYLTDSLPNNLIKIGAVFDNVIKLEGYTIESEKVVEKEGVLFSKENQTININLYFRSIAEKIPKDFDVFLHTEGDKKDMRTKGDENMAMGAYPTIFWKRGEIIRHPIKIKIPKGSKNNFYTAYVGIYQEEYRGNITNKDEVPNDGNNRIELVKIYLDK